MLLFLLACGPSDNPEEVPTPEEAQTDWIPTISSTQSEAAPTAFTIAFTTAEPATGRVRVNGVETGPTDLGVEHEVFIYGPPLSDLSVTVLATVDEEQHESSPFTVTTGQLLPDTPQLEITIDTLSSTAPWKKRVLVTHMYGEPTSWSIIADLSGEVLWSLEQDGKGLGVIPRLDSGQLAVNVFYGKDSSLARLYAVNLVGERLWDLATPGAHHVFDFIDDDPVWIQYDRRRIGPKIVIGDALIRGANEQIFTTWDHMPLDTDESDLETDDWLHTNWITHDRRRESLLISYAKASTITELDLDGNVLRTIGGDESDYELDREKERPQFPHGAHWYGKELMVITTQNQVTQAARFRLDDEQMTMEKSWEFGTEYDQQAQALGEVQALGDGHFLVCWGALGILQVVNEEGTVLWEAQTQFGRFFSQVHLLQSPYSPMP